MKDIATCPVPLKIISNHHIQLRQAKSEEQLPDGGTPSTSSSSPVQPASQSGPVTSRFFLSVVNKIEPCFKQGHRSPGTINREKLRRKIDNMYLYSMKGVPLPLGRPSICRRGLRWAGLRLRGPFPRVVWAFPLPPPRCLSWGCRRSPSVRPCPTTVGPKRTTS